MLKKQYLAIKILAPFLLLALLSSCVAPGVAPPVSAPISPISQQTIPVVATGVAQVAVNSGVFTCGSRLDTLANFLLAGSQGVGTMLFIPPNNQNQRLISVSFEIPATASVPVVYASTSVAPGQANGCGGMYESVIYWRESCQVIANRNFGGLKIVGPLAKSITVLDGGIYTKIFLMPAGNGCVSIKKEIVQ